MALTTVFLDAGGVLVNPNWRRVRDTLDRHGVAVDTENLVRAEPHVKHELDRPHRIRRTDDDSRGLLLFHQVLARAGIERSPATEAALEELRDYHARHNIWESVLPGVREGLDRLRAAGLKLVVVSNANGTVDTLFERLELTAAFHDILDSQVEGVEKPNPEIFHRALDRVDSHPDETVHVGDLYEVDVVGARSAGIRGILVDSANLYDVVDCPKVTGFPELIDLVTSGTL